MGVTLTINRFVPMTGGIVAGHGGTALDMNEAAGMGDIFALQEMDGLGVDTSDIFNSTVSRTTSELIAEPPQKVPGWKRWLSKAHLAASALVAGGIGSWSYYRFLTNRQLKEHYIALVKGGAKLDMIQRFDAGWANDFVTVPAMISLSYLAFVVSQKIFSGKENAGRYELMRGMQTAVAFSVLANVFKEMLGEHDKLSGATYSTFDEWDIWMYATSGVLMHLLFSIAWWKEPKILQPKIAENETLKWFKRAGIMTATTALTTVSVYLLAVVSHFNLPVSMALFMPAIIVSGLFYSKWLKIKKFLEYY